MTTLKSVAFLPFLRIPTLNGFQYTLYPETDGSTNVSKNVERRRDCSESFLSDEIRFGENFKVHMGPSLYGLRKPKGTKKKTYEEK